jgi:flagellar basal body-associated protein FliL
MKRSQKKQMSIMMLLGLLVVLTLVAGLLLSLSNIAKQQRMYSIFTFQECKDAGYPIMESYPEQCSTPDGRTFMNDSQTVQNIQVSTSTELDFNTSSPQAI